MLKSPLQPSSYSLRVRRKSGTGHSFEDEGGDPSMADADFDDEGESSGQKGRSKSRRELPAGAVATLKAWLLSPEHFTHPYPTPQDQAMLMQKTGIDKKQLKNWFTNARRRIWKPMLKKQIEQGKLTATGAPGVPGGVPGLMIPTMPGAPPPTSASMENPHSVQAMRVHYQQAVQQQQQDQCQAQAVAQQQPAQPAQQIDAYGNPVFVQAPAAVPGAAPVAVAPAASQYYVSQPVTSNPPAIAVPAPPNVASASNNSIGSLPTAPTSSANMSKTDSHAVLMELFARDQDLVRQATESARLKAESRQQGEGTAQTQQQPGATQQQHPLQQQPQPLAATSQHPMKVPSQAGLHSVPTLNSWPHFSSINSLNNLGTIPGVKSITSMSGADLAGKGNVNKMGNLAQVKSMESTGKNDSYAFLEVFFGDRSVTNLANMGGKDQKVGMKSTGDEDNEIGLSLEDESPSHPAGKKEFPIPAPAPVQPAAAPGMPTETESGTLKRAYDDALAARGLMSVSRSSEKLTDLVLPAKIQRTLSQELMNKQQIQKQPPLQPTFTTQYNYTSTPAPAAPEAAASSQAQYPGQQPVEPQGDCETDGHVKVSTTTTCAICHQTNVDTQLRPCGHMFHERCLKPSLQTAMGPPKCPIDDIPMHSAVLAIPTDENVQVPPQPSEPPKPQQPQTWTYATQVQQQAPTERKGTT